MDSFEDYIEEIKKIEKKLVSYSPYEGKIAIAQLLDLNPDDYVELSFNDLSNLYERTQKITKAASMLTRVTTAAPAQEVLSKAAPPKEAPALSKKKEEEVKAVEESIKKITQESIEAAEKIKAASLPEEKEVPPPSPAYGEKIEFEHETPSKTIEFEKEVEKPKATPKQSLEVREIEITREIEIEKLGEEKPPTKKIGEEEKISHLPKEEKGVAEEPVKIEKEEEEKRPVVEEVKFVLPETLESPDKAAEEKYKEIEKEVLIAIGEGADEATIKKKMLELTKELFKEKSTARREHLKLEITILKNFLVQKKAAPAIAKKGKAATKEKSEEVAHSHLFETITATQRIELAQTKDSIMANYKNQIVPLKTKFEKALSEELSDKEKKDAYDSFVFNLTSILEHTPAVMTKYCDYLKKKHLAELSNIEKNIDKSESEVLKKIEERKKDIDNYVKEFAALEDIIRKDIETLIRRGGREIFKKMDAEKTAQDIEEEKIDEILTEIQSTDEGTLLFYLHSKDLEYYKKYEHKQVSKTEALSYAKVLMAKEKGLSSNVIKKYFSDNLGG